MRSSRRNPLFFSLLLCAAVLTALPSMLRAQEQKPNWSAQEKPIYDQIAGLRKLPDDQRAKVTRQVALDIRALPNTQNKVRLANGLASRATEGDFGRDTLQEVATTLADALQALPQPDVEGGPAPAYSELAQLVRYEHMTGLAGCSAVQSGHGQARGRRRRPPARQLYPHRFERQNMDAERTEGQGGAGELLGDVVSAVPQGNARPAGAL